MRRPEAQLEAQAATQANEAAIAHGCRHYSERGELLVTTRAVLECLRREGYVAVEDPDP